MAKQGVFMFFHRKTHESIVLYAAKNYAKGLNSP